VRLAARAAGPCRSSKQSGAIPDHFRANSGLDMPYAGQTLSTFFTANSVEELRRSEGIERRPRLYSQRVVNYVVKWIPKA
jgi:hypothetical protein